MFIVCITSGTCCDCRTYSSGHIEPIEPGWHQSHHWYDAELICVQKEKLGYLNPKPPGWSAYRNRRILGFAWLLSLFRHSILTNIHFCPFSLLSYMLHFFRQFCQSDNSALRPFSPIGPRIPENMVSVHWKRKHFGISQFQTRFQRKLGRFFPS